ncbi:glycosyltransferase family 4 protein [Cellvibrio sp. PSBB006]|uniref:glycosyltransferase family 4 protein n=1 Tax=Cellvibrio sp. PSBB006 TaxID=1987723 RepID=UPI000B3B886A|nr:glycosyltransferase family 4 protein [Cellvibrio sp. PSBB006]ARU26807.1 hypothetical protein CBR65_04835 [Cellvibrio sp. PSBB006]
MKKILMIGPVPPPYTGQSVSFQKLKASFCEQSTDPIRVYHVNTAPKGNEHVTGLVSASRILETFNLVVRVVMILLMNNINSMYLTKGSTKFGFLRDLMILLCRQIFSRKTRFVVHLKGGNYDTFYYSCGMLLKVLVRFFLRKSSTIVVLGNSLVKMYDFMPSLSSKIMVVENALTFDCDYVSSGLEKNSVVQILFLSNLIYSKGCYHLLDAVKILLDRGVANFRLTYAGQFMGSPDDPPDFDIKENSQSFTESIAGENLKDYVTYVGVVSGDFKKNLLLNSKVFVLPTRYHVEGQPVSIIEAMAYGCAIVTTKYRSIPDITVENENALYVEYGSPESIADSLETFLKNSDLLEQYSKASRKIYETRFKWEIHLEKMKKAIFGF